MATKSYLSSFLMFVAAVFLCQVNADSEGTMSVTIHNEVPAVLKVHCFSKDDDLHVRYLASRASFSFYFQSNFWGSTLFSCSFRDGVRWNSFPVWTDRGIWAKKRRPCDQCVWIVQSDAFYRAQSGSVPIAVHPWKRDTPSNSMNPV